MITDKQLLKKAEALLKDYNRWNGDDYDATVALLDDMGTFVRQFLEKECTNKTETYYQPVLRFACDPEPDKWELPDGLASFHAFATKEDAAQFVTEMGFSNFEMKINEYHGDDIEGVTILDGYGNAVETNGED